MKGHQTAAAVRVQEETRAESERACASLACRNVAGTRRRIVMNGLTCETAAARQRGLRIFPLLRGCAARRKSRRGDDKMTPPCAICRSKAGDL